MIGNPLGDYRPNFDRIAEEAAYIAQTCLAERALGVRAHRNATLNRARARLRETANLSGRDGERRQISLAAYNTLVQKMNEQITKRNQTRELGEQLPLQPSFVVLLREVACDHLPEDPEGLVMYAQKAIELVCLCGEIRKLAWQELRASPLMHPYY